MRKGFKKASLYFMFVLILLFVFIFFLHLYSNSFIDSLVNKANSISSS